MSTEALNSTAVNELLPGIVREQIWKLRIFVYTVTVSFGQQAAAAHALASFVCMASRLMLLALVVCHDCRGMMTHNTVEMTAIGLADTSLL